ncbi:MAG: tRNA1(Val) (adenine(37)-N6)-methyltransferase [Christensenellaceae bacterium]|jgi:tRNA1(Val) A37 N6-methylase TrmN6|nr:tRNA1(Val) (adenine(37)-N6)-methyltransferase [Christensenellaceae bacterium]
MTQEGLLPGEELVELNCKGLYIIQSKNGYTFTTDAVLLANFAKAYKGARVCDLGTGSGVIPTLMSAKTTAKAFVGVELQPRLADSAMRSVILNNLQERVSIINADIKGISQTLGRGAFDIVVSNPPYSPFDGDTTTASETDICKKEVFITLSELVREAAKLLKFGGKFYVILKAERLTDLLCCLRAENLEPKVITPVQPTPDKSVDTVIVESLKGGKPPLIMKKPFIVFDANGSYTPEAAEIYTF